LANFKNVTVWGQSDYSNPSFIPDYRVTSMARNMAKYVDLTTEWRIRETYMVGNPRGQGWIATHPSIKTPHPLAEPFNYFKNGYHIGASHQGFFNDHREK